MSGQAHCFRWRGLVLTATSAAIAVSVLIGHALATLIWGLIFVFYWRCP